MAKSGAVWGIDIGQSALKALRCSAGADDKLTADAFDFVEYPKILSQPDADPAELIREALQTFLSRNNVKGDRVAMSVSGQSGLARFVKLPPVEAKKIPDLVKFEARQQIPFALEDVIWDYQQMAGGSVEEGFALETEVGLFAMKRDQVRRALKPFDEARIEVDIVQLTPLALYNFATFDQMPDLPPAEEFNPEEPPPSLVILSLGTDTTDLVVTNGFRVWQRSVPLGGNQFTKALMKEMKLTFAKAEHLKRNAAKSEDPKAVFQAMRPVFQDLLGEINRSISFFASVDRNAKIDRVLALGNAMKLPGLQKYLAQHLEMDVKQLDSFRNLTGSEVVNSPAFKDNILSFPVCYGLAIQGVGQSKLSTNLLPGEILKDRKIREKKPWAVAAAATLLVGCGVGFYGNYRTWAAVHEDRYKDVNSQAKGVKDDSDAKIAAYQAKVTEKEGLIATGTSLTAFTEKGVLWAELLKVIGECLPTPKPLGKVGENAKTAKDAKGKTGAPPINLREELHVTSIDCQYFTDLSTWYTALMTPAEGAAESSDSSVATATDPTATDTTAAPEAGAEGEVAATPVGPGWVVEIKGYHYHNDAPGATKKLLPSEQGYEYVRNTLIEALESKKLELPGPDGKPMTWTTKEVGISFPMVVNPQRNVPETLLDPYAKPVSETSTGSSGASGTRVKSAAQLAAEKAKLQIRLSRTNFTVQFVWIPTTVTQRLAKRAEAVAAAKAAALAAASEEGGEEEVAGEEGAEATEGTTKAKKAKTKAAKAAEDAEGVEPGAEEEVAVEEGAEAEATDAEATDAEVTEPAAEDAEAADAEAADAEAEPAAVKTKAKAKTAVRAKAPAEAAVDEEPVDEEPAEEPAE